MYKVYNVSWAGLHFHVATFGTLKEANQFKDEHKDYTLIIKNYIRGL